MAYPYDDLTQTLGRPLTADETQQVVTATGGRPAPGAASYVDAITPPSTGGVDPIVAANGQQAPAFGSTPAVIPSLPNFAPSSGTTFQAPTLAPAPTYTAPTLQLPDTISAPTYSGMTEAQLLSDPSYQWRFDQGRKALEAGAAARGTLRTGGTLKGLIDYGQNAASQEYAAADARQRANFDTNWNAQLSAYDRNLDSARIAADFGLNVSDRQYDAAQTDWAARSAADQRAAELQFDRDWQREVYGRDDAYRNQQFIADQLWRQTDDDYRKQVYATDDAYRKAVYGTDDDFRKAVQAENDAWKRFAMEEDRRRWLAEMGAQQ